MVAERDQNLDRRTRVHSLARSIAVICLPVRKSKRASERACVPMSMRRVFAREWILHPCCVDIWCKFQFRAIIKLNELWHVREAKLELIRSCASSNPIVNITVDRAILCLIPKTWRTAQARTRSTRTKKKKKREKKAKAKARTLVVSSPRLLT